jgi:hypothetical protein
MKTATFVIFLAVLACGLSPAQTTDEKDVLQFERDACKAFLDADVTALARGQDRLQNKMPDVASYDSSSGIAVDVQQRLNCALP